MNIIYRSTRKDGRLFQHIPVNDRPCSITIEAHDDDGGVYMFHSDGQTVTPCDWFDAEINGRRYANTDAWHDHPESVKPVPVYFAYGGAPNADDLVRIAEAINRVVAEPVHFKIGEVVTVTI